jgi:hypothetical protein
VKPDATMQPDERDQRRHQHHAARPDHVELEGITVAHIDEPAQHARAQHVDGEPEGDQEPRRELDEFAGRHAQGTALPQLPEGQPRMDQEGHGKHKLGGRRPPEAHEDATTGLHRVERDQAQRVVG